MADVGRQFDLPPDWINVGPDSLLDKGLPAGFCDRLEREDFGALVVWFAGRLDLIAFKIYAAANSNREDPDSSRHYQDLIDLSPSQAEMTFGLGWMGSWAEADLLEAAAETVMKLGKNRVP